MREIKFRYWDEDTQQYYKVYEITKTRKGLSVRVIDDTGFQYSHTIQAAEIEQFTGIQDSNGVDIYEGDVCRYGITCFTVVFKSGAFGYMFFGDFHWLVNFNNADLKVIGNIHQHPHLLEE